MKKLIAPKTAKVKHFRRGGRAEPDYDYETARREGEGPDGRGHWTDRHKLPNHPTFSNESVRSGTGQNRGGQWIKQPDGTFHFLPGPANLRNRSMRELRDYFREVEPGNRVLTPRGAQPIDGFARGGRVRTTLKTKAGLPVRRK